MNAVVLDAYRDTMGRSCEGTRDVTPDSMHAGRDVAGNVGVELESNFLQGLLAPPADEEG